MTTGSDNLSEDIRSLRLLRVESLTLGVPDEMILAISDWTEPAPLPFAPPSVLGIVSMHGRMFTVVDVAALLARKAATQSRSIVALRGDEQLALAVDEPLEVVSVKPDEVVNETETDLIQGTIRLNGEQVLLLDVDSLFAGIIRGRERRRRRL
ncbi:MAG TPA: chemotaxis protein CheW [Pyrinomonadaceae bacterium]|nr:chemotaxis protein CheW [Pyrinomonadaceae bacterium]